MFKVAIKKALMFIRPLATGRLTYKDKQILNCLSSIMVINKNGDMLTTTNTASLFIDSEELNEIYNPILLEIKEANSDRKKRKIEEKYGITENTVVAIHNILIDVAKNPGRLNIIKHKYLDLAVVQIENNDELFVKDFPKFVNKLPEVGTSICNLGFAFPEYDTFNYNEELCSITSTNKVMNFPAFPVNGMITRNMIDTEGNLTMTESNAEVIDGLQGGAMLDQDGNILGMLIGTNVIQNNRGLNMRLGISINSKTIIEFLKENNIECEIAK